MNAVYLPQGGSNAFYLCYLHHCRQAQSRLNTAAITAKQCDHQGPCINKITDKLHFVTYFDQAHVVMSLHKEVHLT